MSIMTSVFHIYGFLITESAADFILQYAKNLFLIYTKSSRIQKLFLRFRNIFAKRITVIAMATLII